MSGPIEKLEKAKNMLDMGLIKEAFRRYQKASASRDGNGSLKTSF